jgi:elongation factor Ts
VSTTNEQPISAKTVKELREKTGAGMMDCKRALQETGGDMDEAVKRLRQQGLADAAKRAGRSANQGMVDSYIHGGGTVGVLIEVNCETDFVARTDDFKKFVHNVALHIAAAKPLYLKADDVPQDWVASEREIYLAQSQDVAEKFRDRAVDGKIAKRLKEICLLDQEFILDQAEKTPRTIEQLRAETSSALGENIEIRRFSLFELGR